MKNIKILFCLLAAMVMITACHKNDSSNPSPCTQLFSVTGGGNYRQFGYADGKLNEYKEGNGNSYSITYQDNGNTEIIDGTNATYTVKLDAAGRYSESTFVDKNTGQITKTTYQATTTAAGMDVVYSTAYYDKGQQVPGSTSNERHQLTIVDGNLIKDVLLNANNVVYSTQSYSYDLSESSKKDGLNNANFFERGYYYLSKNLLIAIRVQASYPTVYSSSTTIDYDHDNDGRIMAQTQSLTSTSNEQTTNSTLKLTYTYKCN